MFSIYAESLVRFFSQIKWAGTSVPVVIAAPDRAYAQVKDWLKDNRGMDYSNASGLNARPYPFMSVWNGLFEPIDALRNPSNFRLKNHEAGIGYAMRKPLAIKMSIDLNIWLENLQQRDLVSYQIYTLFPDQRAVIPVDFNDTRWYASPNEGFEFAKILGVQFCTLFMNRFTDGSTLENSQLEPRKIRLVWAGELHGWLPYPPYAVPLALSQEFELCDENGVLITKIERD